MSKSDNLGRFFEEDGRTVILPIDHGTAIPVPELGDPNRLIESVSGSVDGFVVNLGLAQACREALRGSGVCLRTDCYKPTYPGNEDNGAFRLFTAEDAMSVGAHAMMNMCYPHHRRESDNLRECAAIISEGRDYSMPVILEALPFNIGRPEDYTVENISFVVRLASELGADVVKTAFPTNGSADDMKQIIKGSLVPVIVLGGAAMGDDEALLTMVSQSMEAGASGIAIGRNVWQHENPPAIASALNAIVHGGVDVGEALKRVQ